MTIFDQLDDREVDTIKNTGTHVTLPADWSPIWEKTPADKAYIIVRGEASVRRKGEEIARLGPGDIVGEGAIVGNKLRNASIVTLTKVELIHFSREQVNALARADPGVRRRPRPGRPGSPGVLSTGTDRVDDARDGVPLDDIERYLLGAPPYAHAGRGGRAGRRAAGPGRGAVVPARLPPYGRRRGRLHQEGRRRAQDDRRAGLAGHPRGRLAGRAGPHLGPQLRPARGVAGRAPGRPRAAGRPPRAPDQRAGRAGHAAGREAAGLRVAPTPGQCRAAAAPHRRGRRPGSADGRRVHRHRRLHQPEQAPDRGRAGRPRRDLRGRHHPGRDRDRGPGDQDDRRRGPLRRRLAARPGRDRAGAHRPGRGRGRHLPAGPRRHRVRRRHHEARRRVRSHRQHRLPAHLDRPARHGPRRPRRLRRADRPATATRTPPRTAPRSPSCSTRPPRSWPTSPRTPSTRT